ncbi:MAG: hypothetical protein WCY11_19900 [Novosphingobium sp.]
MLGLFGVTAQTVAQTSLQHEVEQGAHSNRRGNQAPLPSQTDPMKDRMDGLTALYDAWRAALTIQANDARSLADNPNYQKMTEGQWSYYQEGQPPRPGQKCAATFVNMNGMLSIAAMGGYKEPALLLLSGMDVPSPNKETTIRATLHQTGERPQSVRVQNFTASGMDVGTIAFAVPSLEAAALGLEDKAEIAIEVDDKRIFALNYHSGHQASARLKRCAEAA